MARASLGNKALSVLVAATMVVSLNAPVSAWAGDDSASAESGTTTEQPQVENTLGGGSKSLADSNSVDEGSSKAVANEQESAAQNADESQQVAENPAAQESAVAEVAEVNGTKYATLQEAFDAATNNCTISVLTNVDLGTENVSNYKTKAKNVTVDFGGNKITSVGDYTLAPLTSNWTFENGTIENTNAAASYGAVMVSLGSPNTVFKGGSNGLSIVSKTNGIFVKTNNGNPVLTIEDGVTISSKIGVYLSGATTAPWNSQYSGTKTLNIAGGSIDGTEAGVFVVGSITKNAKEYIVANISGGTITGGYYAVAGNGESGHNGTKVNISGGTLKSRGADGAGIYHPQKGALSISGGTIEGAVGVQMCAGDLTVADGATIKATGIDDTASKTGDGAIADGSAISIVDRNYPGGKPTATVSGGNFDSANGLAAIRAYGWSNNAVTEFDNTDHAVTVSGGTFSAEVPAEYCAEGFASIKNADGTYGVAAAQIGDKNYASVQAAIEAAVDGDTVKLLAGAVEDVTVAEGKSLTLDLNGFKLTNVKDHTITNNGTLVIADSSAAKTGAVDNVTHARGALVNYGTATLKGGLFERSQEKGVFEPYGNGGNSWYTVLNKGTMTIEDGTTVSNAGGYSSNLCNADDTNAKMVINGGTFSGGVNAVKNGSKTTLEITGGTFTNTSQFVIMNWSKATISGGSFVAEGTAPSVLFTSSYGQDKDDLRVSGGSFAGSETMIINYWDDNNRGNAAVSGGTFSAEVPSDCCAEGFACVKNSDGTYGVAEKGAEVKPEGGNASGSVSTSGVVVEQTEQQKVAETAAEAAASVKNATVDESKNEARIGNVTVDTSAEGKTDEVKKVAEEAGKENNSVSTQLIIKAVQTAVANEKINETVSKDSKVVPFELSIDMVTEVKSADNQVVATATVPVKETENPIEVTIKVDPKSIAGKNVVVARVHDGEVELIEPSKINDQTGDVTFKTAKFSDYAVVVSEKDKSYKLEDYTNADGIRKSINNADFNMTADYTFVGWYKDSSYTTPYKSDEKAGDAYPLFKKTDNYIQYMGGSLRMDGPEAFVSTSLRFGYITSAPEGAKYIDSWWTWNDGLTEQVPVHATNRVLFSNGAALANLVVATLGAEYYTTTFHVTEHLKYQTVDGTTVEVAETTPHQHSVETVAKAILENSGASSDEQAYAQKILNTIEKE